MGEVINIRFPNDYAPIEVPKSNFDIKEFEVSGIYEDEVFGRWGDIHVSVSRKDFDKLVEENGLT